MRRCSTARFARRNSIYCERRRALPDRRSPKSGGIPAARSHWRAAFFLRLKTLGQWQADLNGAQDPEERERIIEAAVAELRLTLRAHWADVQQLTRRQAGKETRRRRHKSK